MLDTGHDVRLCCGVARITGDKIALRKQRVALADVIARATQSLKPLNHSQAISARHRGKGFLDSKDT